MPRQNGTAGWEPETKSVSEILFALRIPVRERATYLKYASDRVGELTDAVESLRSSLRTRPDLDVDIDDLRRGEDIQTLVALMKDAGVKEVVYSSRRALQLVDTPVGAQEGAERAKAPAPSSVGAGLRTLDRRDQPGWSHVAP
jgi:hypothetical protein